MSLLHLLPLPLPFSNMCLQAAPVYAPLCSCSPSPSCSSPCLHIEPSFQTEEHYLSFKMPIKWLQDRCGHLERLYDPHGGSKITIYYTMKGNLFFMLIPDPDTMFDTVRYIPLEIPVNSLNFKEIRYKNRDTESMYKYIPDAELHKMIWPLYHHLVTSVVLPDIYHNSRKITSCNQMKMVEFNYKGFSYQAIFSPGAPPFITQYQQKMKDTRVVITRQDPTVWGWGDDDTKYKLVPTNYILEEGERELKEKDYPTEILRIVLEDNEFIDVITRNKFNSYILFKSANNQIRSLHNMRVHIIKDLLFDRIEYEYLFPDENDYDEIEMRDLDSINNNLHPLSKDSVRNIVTMPWNETRHELYLSGALDHNSLLCGLVLGCSRFGDIKLVANDIYEMLCEMSFTHYDYILKK